MKVFTLPMSYDRADELFSVKSWPQWGCGAESFDWSYPSSNEVCYILEGEAEIITDEGSFTIAKGMLVEFPCGLACTWDVKEPIKKHYSFGFDISSVK